MRPADARARRVELSITEDRTCLVIFISIIGILKFRWYLISRVKTIWFSWGKKIRDLFYSGKFWSGKNLVNSGNFWSLFPNQNFKLVPFSRLEFE